MKKKTKQIEAQKNDETLLANGFSHTHNSKGEEIVKRIESAPDDLISLHEQQEVKDVNRGEYLIYQLIIYLFNYYCYYLVI